MAIGMIEHGTTSDLSGDKQGIRTYKKRWAMLALFCFANLCNMYTTRWLSLWNDIHHTVDSSTCNTTRSFNDHCHRQALLSQVLRVFPPVNFHKGNLLIAS